VAEIFRKQALLADRRRSRAEQPSLTVFELVATLGALLAIAFTVAIVTQIALRLSGQ
jgi:hypothetical protein